MCKEINTKMKAEPCTTSEVRTLGNVALPEKDMDDDHYSPSCSDVGIVDDSSSDGTMLSYSVDFSTRRSTARIDQSKRKLREKNRLAVSMLHRHLITQHEYHDHALDLYDDSNFASPSCRRKDNKAPSNAGTPCTNFAAPFPTKLYEMIDEIETQGLSHVVSWQPHGRCFKVHQMSTFKILLLDYFKLRKLASFQRQLNLYGFQRLTVGLDKGSYYHELFLRSRPDLVRRIERMKVKGTGVRAKSNPDDEPNLYSFPAVDARAKNIFCVSAEQLVQGCQSMNQPNTPSNCDECGVRSILLYCKMDAIDSNTKSCTGEQGSINDDVTASTVSYISDTLEKPCSIMNGLVRNLSSLNVFPVDRSELSLCSWKNAGIQKPWKNACIQNASFSVPTPYCSSPTSNYLRNISSCNFNNNSSFASMLTSDFSTAGHADELNRVQSNEHQFTMDKLGMNKNATLAVEKLLVANETDYSLSFTKLVDDMFQCDQNIEFPDLIKLAFVSDTKRSE